MDLKALELLERQFYTQLGEGGWGGRINKVLKHGLSQPVELYDDSEFKNRSVFHTI